MPLTFAPEPLNGSAVVNQHLDNYERHLAAYKGIQSVPLHSRPVLKWSSDSYAPHPVYKIKIDHILKGDALQHAHHSGFFYVLDNYHGHPSARAHLVTDEFGVSRLYSLSFGTYSRHVIPALAKLAVHDLLRNTSYEARCLRCKGCLFMALWLKSNDGLSTDLIYPLDLKQHFLSGEPPYPADEYLKALAPVAQRFLRTHNNASNSDSGSVSIGPVP